MALATAFASCPNRTFLKKHFCHWCKTEKDALKFATDSNSHRTNPTQINDVIMSSNKNSGQVGFHMNGKYCEHATKRDIMHCSLQTKKCTIRKDCLTFHDANNSHLYYKITKCAWPVNKVQTWKKLPFFIWNSLRLPKQRCIY